MGGPLVRNYTCRSSGETAFASHTLRPRALPVNGSATTGAAVGPANPRAAYRRTGSGRPPPTQLSVEPSTSAAYWAPLPVRRYHHRTSAGGRPLLFDPGVLPDRLG